MAKTIKKYWKEDVEFPIIRNGEEVYAMIKAYYSITDYADDYCDFDSDVDWLEFHTTLPLTESEIKEAKKYILEETYDYDLIEEVS